MKASYPLNSLIDRWEHDARDLQDRYGQPQLATLTLRHVSELREALTRETDETVSLTDAATISGYSRDHLGRLVKIGRLQNVGTRTRPKVRRGDLPKKASNEGLRESELSFTVGVTREQIARAVVTSQP